MKKRFKLDSPYVYWGVTVFLVVACSMVFFLILNDWPSVRAILQTSLTVASPVIYGLMFAYLFNKIMIFIETKIMSRLVTRFMPKLTGDKKKRFIRVISLLLTMVAAILIISGTLTLIVPQLVASLRMLVFALPGYFDTAVGWITRTLEDNPTLESAVVNMFGNIVERLTAWIQTTLLSQADQIVANLLGGVIGVLRVIANLVIGIVISVYIMYHKERFSAQAKKVVYGIFSAKTANSILGGVRFLDKTCGSFLTSKLIDSLIVGLICYIFMVVLAMPYPMLISAIVGITNIIPFFGPFIGGAPSALLILLANPAQGLIFIIFIVILQQLDGNVIYPKIQGSSIGISGFWIIFALLIFGGMFGFWGMLLGVPIFAVIYNIVKGVNKAQLTARGLPDATEEYELIELIDSETNEPVYKNTLKPQENEVKADDKTDDQKDS